MYMRTFIPPSSKTSDPLRLEDATHRSGDCESLCIAYSFRLSRTALSRHRPCLRARGHCIPASCFRSRLDGEVMLLLVPPSSQVPVWNAANTINQV